MRFGISHAARMAPSVLLALSLVRASLAVDPCTASLDTGTPNGSNNVALLPDQFVLITIHLPARATVKSIQVYLGSGAAPANFWVTRKTGPNTTQADVLLEGLVLYDAFGAPARFYELLPTPLDLEAGAYHVVLSENGITVGQAPGIRSEVTAFFTQGAAADTSFPPASSWFLLGPEHYPGVRIAYEPCKCGDGIAEAPFEQCDLGAWNGAGNLGESCCTSECSFRPLGFPCRASSSTCELPAECLGTLAICPPNRPEPADKGCVDSNACTKGDHCSGIGTCVGTNICIVKGTCPGPFSCVGVPPRRRLKARLAVTEVRAGSAASLVGTASGAQLRASGALPPRCSEDQVASDRDEYQVCRSQQKTLKKAGSPVKLRCRPTPCLKSYLKITGKGSNATPGGRAAGSGPGLDVRLSATFANIGLDAEAELAGTLEIGQVNVGGRRSHR